MMKHNKIGFRRAEKGSLARREAERGVFFFFCLFRGMLPSDHSNQGGTVRIQTANFRNVGAWPDANSLSILSFYELQLSRSGSGVAKGISAIVIKW
jgi:hypothetical protein